MKTFRTIRWLEAHGRIEPWDASPDYERIVAACQDWCRRGAEGMTMCEQEKVG